MTREEIARRIAELSVLHGSFTLRSGRTSTWYIDKYRFSTDPDVLKSLGELFRDRIPPETTRLAGAELGGIPLVTTAAMASGLPCLFVRNQKKDYGTAQRFEGHLDQGDRLTLLEDVATTGGQVLEAARDLEAAGATIIRIISTVDRLEGARQNIESAGYAFDSLFTVRDLGIEVDPSPTPDVVPGPK